MQIQKRQFVCGISFTSVSSLCNYYQPLDLLSVVSCVGSLYCEYYECISKIISLIENLEI